MKNEKLCQLKFYLLNLDFSEHSVHIFPDNSTKELELKLKLNLLFWKTMQQFKH